MRRRRRRQSPERVRLEVAVLATVRVQASCQGARGVS